MAGTVETDLQFFQGTTGGDTSCDSEADWTGHYSLDNEMMIQGTGCLTIKASKGTGYADFAISGSVDLTGKLIYAWAFFADPIGRLGDKSAGGFGIKITDEGGNYGVWYIAGKDTWDGGWKAFAQHIDAPFDEVSGTVDKTAITQISIRFTTVAVAKVTPNCYFDAIRYGTKLKIRGGSEADPGTFDDFINAENYWDGSKYPNKWGVTEREAGILVAQGNLQFGSTISGQETYFQDIDEVLVFNVLPNSLPEDFYQLEIVGNPGTFTTVLFGKKVGESGVSGCAFRTAGAAKYRVIASDENISTLGLLGCSFFDANTIDFGVYSVTRESLNTSFSNGRVIYAQESIFKFCNFINADDIATQIDDVNFKISESNFIANPRAMEITTPGTFTFTGLAFTGNSIDIRNSSGGTVVINLVSGSQVDAGKIENVGESITNLILSVSLTLTGLKEFTEVTIVKIDTQEVLFKEEVGADREIIYIFEGTALSGATVDILIHDVQYEPLLIPEYVLPTTDTEIPITQYWDRIYYNP